MAKLKFKDDNHSSGLTLKDDYWGVLVVDDDAEVHTMTKFVMKDWAFDNRVIRIFNADSSRMAKEVLAERDDISLILLDVVMEDDQSGLDLVRYIREELNDRFIRIILRTGQPGKAPVRSIINDYEINDYKEKSELTADRLFVSVTAALRSYNDIMTVESSRKGLQDVLDATSSLLTGHSISSFADGFLLQIAGLVDGQDDSIFLQHECIDQVFNSDEIHILAGTGSFTDKVDLTLKSLGDDEITCLVEKAFDLKSCFFEGDDYIGYFPISGFAENYLIFRGLKKVSEFKKQLLRIFSDKASMAFMNLVINRDFEEAQQEVIYTLGDIVESQSMETRHHIQRVSEMAMILGKSMNMDQESLRNLQIAASMHDVGNIGIPDEILHKPGLLNSAEIEIMKTHTQLGYEILKNSDRAVMKTAAIIALEHHERWDGRGYPFKKSEFEISLVGRIMAIVDVFDALYNRRIYKEPWPLSKIKALFEDEKGGHFDPEMVDRFFENIEAIICIQNRIQDQGEPGGS